MACHGATKVSPYQLVYGHEDELPWELGSRSRCVTVQDDSTAYNYATLMKDEFGRCSRASAKSFDQY